MIDKIMKMERLAETKKQVKYINKFKIIRENKKDMRSYNMRMWKDNHSESVHRARVLYGENCVKKQYKMFQKNEKPPNLQGIKAYNIKLVGEETTSMNLQRMP